MSRNEYLWYLSEIGELETLLGRIPEEKVISRKQYEYRLQEAREAIKDIVVPASQKMKLTFHGKPVVESYGIRANFMGQALDIFTNAVASVAASLKGILKGSSGSIPEKQQSSLLVVGPAIGSFGFELELPDQQQGALFEELDSVCESIKRIQMVFQAVAGGTDEDLSESVGEIHPRAVDYIHEFLNLQSKHGARCALEFDGHLSCFQNDEEVGRAVHRLAKDNRVEASASFRGVLIGVLPVAQRFELETEQGEIKRGRTALVSDDGKRLMKDYADRRITMVLKEVRVGQGKPRYTLESLEDVSLVQTSP